MHCNRRKRTEIQRITKTEREAIKQIAIKTTFGKGAKK